MEKLLPRMTPTSRPVILTPKEPTMPEQPWYQEGLQFTCTQCGDCCTGSPGYVWLTDTEATAIAEYISEPRAEFLARFTYLGRRGRSLREKPGGDCIFFEKGKGCTIYPVR